MIVVDSNNWFILVTISHSDPPMVYPTDIYLVVVDEAHSNLGGLVFPC